MIARILIALLLTLSLAYAQETPERSAEDFIADGDFNLQRGECSFAQYFFQEALKLEPENAEAMLGKGKALICQRAFETGIEEFGRILNSDPNNVPARVQLAKAYQEQYSSDPARYADRLGEALAVLAPAEGLAPDDAEVFNTKGVVLFLQGDMENARIALEQAAAESAASELTSPDQAAIHINLGRTYRELGELEQALQAFRRAAALNPTSASAHNNVGDIYYRLGNCEGAIYELTQATNLNPTLLDAAANLAISLFECDQVEASLPRFEAAIAIPGSINLPPLYSYVSRVYVLQGRLDDAVRRAQQGALLPPSSADAYFYLGQAYEARNGEGDLVSARDAYQRALELDANYAPAREALSRIGQ